MISDFIANSSTYKKLLRHNTHSSKFINDISDLTVGSYLTGIISAKNYNNNFYFNVVIEVLEDYLERSFNVKEAQIALDEFKKFPAIQVADHIGLFYDPTNFMNNFLWNIALKNNNIKYIFTSQCETVRALQNTKILSGPALLHFNRSIYNIFDLSKDKLKNINIAALNNCRFLFKLIQGEGKISFPDILQNIVSISQKSGYAPDLFNRANLLFWNSMKYEGKCKMMLFDRRFFCDVVAENIKQESEILKALLFNNETRKSFLKIKARIIGSPRNLVLRNTTDFFYLKKGEELVGLKVNDEGIFYEERSGKIATIDGRVLSVDSKLIYDGLRNRDLYPDLITSNIFGHILPNVMAIGGTSQLEYLPVMVKILTEFLKENLSNELGYIEKLPMQSYGRLTGPSLIKLNELDGVFIENINSNSDLNNFENRLINKKIGDVLNIDFWNYFDVFYSRLQNDETTP